MACINTHGCGKCLVKKKKKMERGCLHLILKDRVGGGGLISMLVVRDLHSWSPMDIDKLYNKSKLSIRAI